MPLTREDITSAYTVAGGIIRSPGRYAARPVWTPYFLALALEGAADGVDELGGYIFLVDASDVERFHELAGAVCVRLWLTDDGYPEVRRLTTR